MMKKLFLISIILLTQCTIANSEDIKLPSPDLKENTLSVTEALQKRHSVRNFDKNKSLSLQQISNLCWAAVGISREDGRLTSPTAMNRQEIRLYIFTKQGIYEYDAKENLLSKKVNGDHRDLLVSRNSKANTNQKSFRQEFVLDAPISLLMVIDFEKFGRFDEKSIQMGCVDAGNVSENINLYCQSAGLATVPRATHDTEAIRALLGFSEKHLPIMNNPVGFEKNK